MLHGFIAEGKAQVYDELAALAFLAVDGDLAAHHVHQIFGDGHAQARALDAADRAGILAGEGLKDMLLELRAHADAVVLDAELVVGKAVRGGGLLDNADADGAAGAGELDGITQNVEQDLVQAQLVRDDVFVMDILGVDEKVQLLGRRIGLDDGAQIMDNIRQVHRHSVDLHLAALDAAHVEHIVDEGQ